MPPLAPARWSGLFVLLFAAATGVVPLACHVAVAQPVTVKRIFVLPVLQWDVDGVRWRYAAEQTATDLGRVMAGLTFGMPPAEVNRLLRPQPANEQQWSDMPVAGEFADEVRYTWLQMNVASTMTAPIKSCFGAGSYVVVLFRASGLFRVSWRFLPDQTCHDVTQASAELYVTFAPIASTVAFSVHYRTGYAEVVDVTDPHAGFLVTQRWQMPGQ